MAQELAPCEPLIAIGRTNSKMQLKSAINAKPAIAAKRWNRAQNDFVGLPAPGLVPAETLC